MCIYKCLLNFPLFLNLSNLIQVFLINKQGAAVLAYKLGCAGRQPVWKSNGVGGGVPIWYQLLGQDCIVTCIVIDLGASSQLLSLTGQYIVPVYTL